MNNKIFFSLMLFVFSPLIASESTALVQQQHISQMWATICAKNGIWASTVRGGVIGIEKRSLEIPILGDTFESIYPRVNAQCITFAKDKKSVEIIGKNLKNNNEYVIKFADDSFINLKKELEKPNRGSISGGFFPVFEIKLMAAGNPLVLVIEESQFQENIMGKWSFTQVMTGFGIAGLAVLIYYFDLYSKGMALLGRG